MAKVATNWDDDLLPAGEYSAQVEDVDEHLTRKGDAALKWWFVVHGENNVQTRVEAITSLKPKQRWMARQFLTAFGIDCKGSQVVDTDLLKSRWCRIQVDHNEFNGRVSESVQQVIEALPGPPEGVQDITKEEFADPFTTC